MWKAVGGKRSRGRWGKTGPAFWLAVAAAAGTAFFVVLILTPRVETFARGRGWVDKPGGRHLHQRPVPRLGGVAIFAGLLAGSGTLAGAGLPAGPVAAVLAGSAMVWLVGLVDDLEGLSPGVKLAGQVAAAAVSVAAGVRVQFISLPLLWGGGEDALLHLGPWSYPLTVLWLVGISNAVNLLDGLDGLAPGVVAIAAVPTALAAAQRHAVEAAGLLAVIGAGCLAFLRYNFAPARIFLGDSGALLLGFAFAAAATAGAAKGPAALALLVPAVSLGVPLFDTAWAVVRRLAAGRSIVEADTEHLHHRLLVRSGRETWRAVLTLYAASAALGATAVVLSPQGRASAVVVLALAVAALALGVRARSSRPMARAAGKVGFGLAGAGDARLRHPAGSHQAGAGYRRAGPVR